MKIIVGYDLIFLLRNQKKFPLQLLQIIITIISYVSSKLNHQLTNLQVINYKDLDILKRTCCTMYMESLGKFLWIVG